MMVSTVAMRRKLASVKTVIFLSICICMLIFLGAYFNEITLLSTRLGEQDQKHLMYRWHRVAIDGFFGLRVIWPNSKLGQILFDQEEIPNHNPNANRKFAVLVWKHWDWLKNRHVYNFGKSRGAENNLLQNCSVSNCIFHGNDSLIDSADAVIVHLQHGLVPKVENRNPKQRWIFLNEESPKNAFSLAKTKPKLESFYNVFNWSMTYRTDSDVPVPYGRTIALKTPVNAGYKTLQALARLVPNWDKKKPRKIAAVLMSNCGSKQRNNFLKKLKKYVDVDVYGGCADKPEFKNGCPGHFKADCDVISEYLFYLVLENDSCFQYLTEKVFYHAYAKGAVPIIFGPTIEDVESLLPPNSYFYADSETNIKLLANDINTLSTSSELLLAMHMWRNHFEIVNEHGYFGTKSSHMCRVCEALNYNDPKEKVYNKDLINSFLNPDRTCYYN